MSFRRRGQGVYVEQVAGLAAPGEACVVTMSSTEIGAVMRSFSVVLA
jgi:hypothetical protein